MFGRRIFLAGMASAAVLPRRVRGAVAGPAPIRIGVIGLGRRGAAVHLPRLLALPDVQVCDLCDVDAARLKQVGESVTARTGYAVRTHADFRGVLAQGDLDAVCLAVPNHWQVPMAVMAVRAGKDVLCESPLSFCVDEGRYLVEEARRCGRVVAVVGAHRSVAVYRRLCERVRNGVLGRLGRIELSVPGEVRAADAPVVFGEPPKTLDYAAWLGPVPWAPYAAARIDGFGRIRAHAGGVVTAAADLLALTQWGHGSEATGPIAVTATGTVRPHALFDAVSAFSATCRYDDGVELRIVTGATSIRFTGERGWLAAEGEEPQPRASDPALLYRPLVPEASRLEGWPAGEHRGFVDRIKDRRPPCFVLEAAHRAATLAHLINLAIDQGRPLAWNPALERTTDPALDRLLHRSLRAPWTV